MTDIKRTMIASLLIEQATELKGKRPTELGFEDLVDVVQGVVKNCSIPVVVVRSEQLKAFLDEIANDKTYIKNDYYKNKAKRLSKSI